MAFLLVYRFAATNFVNNLVIDDKRAVNRSGECVQCGHQPKIEEQLAWFVHHAAFRRARRRCGGWKRRTETTHKQSAEVVERARVSQKLTFPPLGQLPYHDHACCDPITENVVQKSLTILSILYLPLSKCFCKACKRTNLANPRN